MSGLLRRIKRSRAADAGETSADRQAAAPEDARTTAEAPAGATASPTAGGPVVAVDPAAPAGLDPEEPPSPTGRRGRLRRRLRYLRRAREVMLRDLGGLLYEVHRTGGGDVGAHSAVIATKVQRLASLDAETGAIESALSAPRAESVVFQPGVGGTCDFCGELYGSAARFCSHCGSPTGSAVRAMPAPIGAPVREVPPMPKPPAEADKSPVDEDEPPTQTLGRAGEDAAAAEKAGDNAAGEKATGEKPIDEPPADEKPGDETAIGDEKALGDEKANLDDNAPDDGNAAAEKPPRSGRSKRTSNPVTGLGNGRGEDGAGPDVPSGDPLARESRP